MPRKKNPKLILRTRRTKGQIAAIGRALENNRNCSDLLQLITAARGAIIGLMAALPEGHSFHVLDPQQEPLRRTCSPPMNSSTWCAPTSSERHGCRLNVCPKMKSGQPGAPEAVLENPPG